MIEDVVNSEHMHTDASASPSRRTFLKQSGALASALASFANPAEVSAQQKKYALSYVKSISLDAVLEYRREVIDAIPESEDGLKIVRLQRGKQIQFGLVYDLGAEKTSFGKVGILAREHGDRLTKRGFNKVDVVEEKGYQELYNVSFARSRNIAALQELYEKIKLSLFTQDKELFRQDSTRLVIERRSDDSYVLVLRINDVRIRA